MRNISLRYKFITIILLLLIPTAVATYLLAKEASGSIEFASKELAGRDYLQSISELQQLIGQHQAVLLSSIARNPAQLTRIKNDMIVKLAELDETDDAMRSILTLDQTWIQSRQAIEALLNADPNLSFDDHSILHAKAIEHMATHEKTIADYSNLSLDQQLDSYYLIDVIKLNLLELLGGLDRYRVVFTEKTGYAYFQEHRFELHALLLKGQLITESIDNAIVNNADLAPMLKPINEQFKTLYSASLDTMDFLLRNANPTMNADAYQEMSDAIAVGYTLYDSASEALGNLLEARISRDVADRKLMLCFVLLVVAVGILFTFVVGRSITRTIIVAKDIATSIADDRLETDIASTGTDEPGQLIEALSQMQRKLKERINEERAQSVINGRIKQALDCVSRVVLMANTKGEIIYCNQAGSAYFKTHEQTFTQHWDGFTPSSVLGYPMQVFSVYQSPDEIIKGQHLSVETSEKIVGDRHLTIMANPVHDAQNHALGTVIEIHDRTDEVVIEQAVKNDILSLVNDALEGDLSGRINGDDKPDFLIPVYNGINDMVAICNSVIDSATHLFQRLADGDMTHGMHVEDATLNGQFLQLQTNANDTIDQLVNMIQQVKEDAAVVTACARTVVQVNQRLEENALSATDRASTVSDTVSSITSNVDSVALAAEQMHESIKEIVRNTHNCTSVAEQAVVLTQAADNKVSQLSSSSRDIGAIIKVINSIAEQTNLLALNATIEAARAGEAGKGFAVVANEVKELAKETAKATEDISEKITAIQSDSSTAADGIREIDGIVIQINNLQSDSAAAMEQQSITTQAISESINTVATGAGGMSTDLSDLVYGTVETGKAVDTAKEEVLRLSQVAANLQELVGRFQLGPSRDSETSVN